MAADTATAARVGAAGGDPLLHSHAGRRRLCLPPGPPPTCWEKKKKKNATREAPDLLYPHGLNEITEVDVLGEEEEEEQPEKHPRFIIPTHGLNEITECRGALDYSLHVFPRVEERLFKRL